MSFCDLSLSAHVSHITSVCFYYLRQLRLVRRSLTMDAAHALVRAMVHSRLDYCNSLLAGLPTINLLIERFEMSVYYYYYCNSTN